MCCCGAAPQCIGPGIRGWLVLLKRQWTLLSSTQEPCDTSSFVCVLETEPSTSLLHSTEPVALGLLHCPSKETKKRWIFLLQLLWPYSYMDKSSLSPIPSPSRARCPALTAEVAQGAVQMSVAEQMTFHASVHSQVTLD